MEIRSKIEWTLKELQEDKYQKGSKFGQLPGIRRCSNQEGFSRIL